MPLGCGSPATCARRLHSSLRSPQAVEPVPIGTVVPAARRGSYWRAVFQGS
jgi:hypothetical protein